LSSATFSVGGVFVVSGGGASDCGGYYGGRTDGGAVERADGGSDWGSGSLVGVGGGEGCVCCEAVSDIVGGASECGGYYGGRADGGSDWGSGFTAGEFFCEAVSNAGL